MVASEAKDFFLDGVFRDLQGTLSGNEYFREMLRDIKKTCPGANVKSGLSIIGSDAANATGQVRKWLAGNGLL